MIHAIVYTAGAGAAAAGVVAAGVVSAAGAAAGVTPLVDSAWGQFLDM
jgi:hypothetical protein